MIPLQKAKTIAYRNAKYLMLLTLQALFLLLFFFFLAMPQLFGQTTTETIQITGVGGASNVEEDFKTIYGGLTHSGDTVCAGATSLCNSCTGIGTALEPMHPCNENEIDDAVTLSITFAWNGENLNNTKVGIHAPNNSSVTKVPGSNTLFNLIKGQSYTVSTSWGRICQMYGCANCRACTGEIPNSLAVGVDSDENGEIDASGASSTFSLKIHDSDIAYPREDCKGSDSGPSGSGVCSFDLFPGDGKLYLDKLAYLSGFPTSSTIGYSGIDVFYTLADDTNVAGSLASIRNDSFGEFYPITDEDDKDFQVLGLENDSKYCVILGARSKAGNITNFFPHPTADGWLAPNGTFCETPQEVFGVLDGKKCFIATAAFGSELDSQVERFREFRNHFLKKTHWGKNLTMFYYQHSPKLAEWLNANPILKPVVQVFLWLILGFVELCFMFGLLPGLIIFLTLSSAAFAGLTVLLMKRKNIRNFLSPRLKSGEM